MAKKINLRVSKVIVFTFPHHNSIKKKLLIDESRYYYEQRIFQLISIRKSIEKKNGTCLIIKKKKLRDFSYIQKNENHNHNHCIKFDIIISSIFIMVINYLSLDIETFFSYIHTQTHAHTSTHTSWFVFLELL